MFLSIAKNELAFLAKEFNVTKLASLSLSFLDY